MSHYFTELLLYILLAYFAGCIIGGLWRNSKPVQESIATRTTAIDQAELVPPPAVVPVTVSTSAADLPSQYEPTGNRFMRPVGLTSPRAGKPDNLARIVGDDAQTLGGLKSIGVYHFDQIARWSDEHSNWVGDHMKFGDRVKREQWVKKANLLAEGKESEFQRLFSATAAASSSEDVSFRVQPLPSSTPPSDDLKRLKGIGPENEKALNALGIRRYEQIAIWSSHDIARVEKHLEFDGRIAREQWVKQAQLLTDEDYERFESLYGETNTVPKKSRQPAAQVKSAAPRERKTKSEQSGKPKGLTAPRGKPDNLQRLNGIGPKYEKILHSLGFYHFDQIASWTAQQVDWIDNHLNFNGRIEREEWIRQAQLLTEGKDEQFERDYGTGGLKNAQGEIQPGNRTRKG
jgi:predicted flap endonuclease-1-like 5' DNA nuclease